MNTSLRYPIGWPQWALACLLLGLLHPKDLGFAAPLPVNRTNTLSLELVLSQLLSNNPSLKAARANWEAMRARVPQARAWEDLRVGVDVERSGTTRFFTFTDNEWMIAQKIPISGKNRLQARAAVAEAASAFAGLRRRELNLTSRARSAYFRYANAQAQLAISQKNETLLKELVTATRGKVEAGTGTLADALAAETGLARLLESRTDIERQVSDEQSQLNVLMNRPAYEELPAPAPSAFKPLVVSRYRPPPTPHSPDTDQFNFDWPAFQQEAQGLALRQRPELLSAQEKIQAAQARYQLAKRQWIPDPEFRIEARQFNGAGNFIREYDTGIFLPVPWLNRRKYQAQIQEMRKTLEAAEQELKALESETLGLVRDQTKKIENAQTHYQFIRERILPLAQQTFQAMQSAYSAGRATFLELFTAQRTLQDTESQLQEHLADYLSAIAELEAIVGTSLDSKL